MTEDQRTEAAAKLAYERNRAGCTEWRDIGEKHQLEWMDKVRPVIAAYLAGDVVVPRELVRRVLDIAARNENAPEIISLRAMILPSVPDGKSGEEKAAR